ncbi:dendritic cell-specific transmembrane protein [Cyclopterus lumpus]|uniref:dendritic cell-specific transmembrane protein n=1 Tax=Cyclopterus lumpus TaxID=8103 RepID=UPI0014875AE1|nr:dendritic cell-specific transmembrane protein [Cyclopterus lumpus]
MKKSRNLLLTAGTSLVVLRNIRNTLENTTGLVRSMICNLKAKKAAIVAPFSSYVKMLKWLGNMLKGVTDLGVVHLDSQLKVSPRLESENFRWKLSEAEQKLNDTATYVQSLMDTVSAVTDRAFPAVSFLALVLLIALHLRRYRGDAEYQNRFTSSAFVVFDGKRKAEGKAHVLPLTPEEEKLYAAVPSARPTAREGRAMLKFGVPGIATLIGIPLGEESHQEDFSYSVTLFEKKCLPEPKLLLYNSVAPLAAILLALFFMALAAAKAAQLRLMVCERFFPGAAEERAEYLHDKILRKRGTKRKGKGSCGLPSLYLKPHFWLPLLFRPKEDPPSVV